VHTGHINAGKSARAADQGSTRSTNDGLSSQLLTSKVCIHTLFASRYSKNEEKQQQKKNKKKNEKKKMKMKKRLNIPVLS
jgi:hypothetical protein